MPSNANSLRRDYPGSTDAPFRQAETFGPTPVARDNLDALRMNWRRTPEATYPDGYLGTIKTRREDRLLNGLKQRMNNRPYTRGVHKGERIDGRDYQWPEEFNLETGIMLQAQAVPSEDGVGWAVPRFAPPGLGIDLDYERYPTDRKVGPKRLPTGGMTPTTRAERSSADRRDHLRQFAPGVITGGTRGNPGMGMTSFNGPGVR